uniref:UL51 protein n=1 Tax=Anatid alphaherpesvirus 2 TaxID=3080522 RepID=A0AAU0K707_9ALPH
MYRLREAVQSVNIMLPTPITLETAVLSSDGVKKLVRGQTIAKTYCTCMQNLECLSKHVPGSGNPGLDAVVETHMDNTRRLADACAAAILHMYMSVGTTDRTDAFVEHAIQLTAATETVMSDVSMAERVLGLRPIRAQPRGEKAAAVPPLPPKPAEKRTERRAEADAAACRSRPKTPSPKARAEGVACHDDYEDLALDEETPKPTVIYDLDRSPWHAPRMTPIIEVSESDAEDQRELDEAPAERGPTRRSNNGPTPEGAAATNPAPQTGKPGPKRAAPRKREAALVEC